MGGISNVFYNLFFSFPFYFIVWARFLESIGFMEGIE